MRVKATSLKLLKTNLLIRLLLHDPLQLDTELVWIAG